MSFSRSQELFEVVNYFGSLSFFVLEKAASNFVLFFVPLEKCPVKVWLKLLIWEILKVTFKKVEESRIHTPEASTLSFYSQCSTIYDFQFYKCTKGF